MVHFKRALVLTLAVTVLTLVLVLAFVLINEVLAKSGFSSGEVFVIAFGEKAITGEFFGEEFILPTAPLQKALPFLEKATLLLPPPLQILLRGVFAVKQWSF